MRTVITSYEREQFVKAQKKIAQQYHDMVNLRNRLNANKVKFTDDEQVEIDALIYHLAQSVGSLYNLLDKK